MAIHGKLVKVGFDVILSGEFSVIWVEADGGIEAAVSPQSPAGVGGEKRTVTCRFHSRCRHIVSHCSKGCKAIELLEGNTSWRCRL